MVPIMPACNPALAEGMVSSTSIGGQARVQSPVQVLPSVSPSTQYSAEPALVARYSPPASVVATASEEEAIPAGRCASPAGSPAIRATVLPGAASGRRPSALAPRGSPSLATLAPSG